MTADQVTLAVVTRTYDSNDLHLAPPPVSGQFAEYTYRSDGQLATKTEHAVTTTFTYDDAGATRNALGWTDTLGRSMAYVLAARGNVTQTSDGTATTHATYDVHNRVIETRDALGNATTYGYNAAGCGCSQDSLVTDIHTPDLPAGVEWRMVYDVDGRLASVTDPHSFTESYAYETTGELKKLTDKLARDTSWTHDQLARVASMVDTLGRRHGNLYMVPSSGAWTGPTLMAGSGDSTASPTDLAAALRAGDYQIGQNAYPTHGQPAAISLYRDATFALSFTRLFDRDRRLTTRADRAAFAFDSSSVPSPVPDGTFWQQRNTWNNLTARPVLVGTETVRSDGASQGSSYGQNIYFDDTVANGSGFEQSSETLLRDVAGRVTSLIRRHDAGGPLTSTYTYRADGRMARIVGPDGTRDFTYDSRGLMETQAVLGEGTYHYGYDVMGRPGSLTYPDGHVRTQVYDDLGRLLVAHEYTVTGPVATMLTTTAIDLDDELMNRCLVLTVDEGREQTSDPFTPDALTDRVRKIVSESGVGKKGACHMFRHTAATLMLEGGADIRYVQQMLGHSKLETTEIYTHVSITKLREVYAATHPAAKLGRSPAAVVARVASPAAADAADLLADLDAEAGEEAETRVETPASTTAPAQGTLRTRCSRSKPT